MKFSIIVPFRNDNDYLKECVEHCLELDHSDYEIILLPDEKSKWKHKKIKVIPTGPVPPSEKRDIAAKHAKGEILAFIDDDAYPRKDWLKNAEKYFKDKDVGAIGGPGVTPESDDLFQKASGFILSSRLGASPGMDYRYIPKKKREVDDYPTCNLIVRKSVFKKVGGFDTEYWPGEDSKFCLDLTKKLKKKIIYTPDVVVYHHRKPLFKKHLRQIRSYGIHRGHFAKKFPETSLRPVYFLPTLFVLGIIFGWLSVFIHPFLFYSYLFVICLYLIMVFLTSLKTKKPRMIVLVFLGIIATHVWYGIGFLRGLLSKESEMEVRSNY